MRTYIKNSVVLVILVSLASCSNKRQRQFQYMPDMYVSVPYDADASVSLTSEISSNLKPVEKTIARGLGTLRVRKLQPRLRFGKS